MGIIKDRANPETLSMLDITAYSINEQATIVETTLKAAGASRRMAPIFGVISHGSTTTNNPFRQAYGCGACSGNSGKPNARVFCLMANSPEVRVELVRRGVELGAQTLFVPIYYDTTSGEVLLLDRQTIPTERLFEVTYLLKKLSDAATIDAQEKTNRFVEGPYKGKDASSHLLMRSYDLAQPRPELGHNRVAACIVGRRDLTKYKHLDRRAFLVSYNQEEDPTGQYLFSAILGSVPVAVNIAMDYYFSRVDPDGFGAGSKLPLNVVSLLGVVTGSKSDLRIGLAKQMVELHEPMRPLVLVEANEMFLRKVVESHDRLQRLVKGEWLRLGRIDPISKEIELLCDGTFVPWRDALGLSNEPRVDDASKFSAFSLDVQNDYIS